MQKVVITAGRFQPITNGHYKLVKKLLQIAECRDAKPILFIVDGQKSKLNLTKNPLTALERKEILENLFSNLTVQIVQSPYAALEWIKEQQYDLKIFMCGDDRSVGYKSMLYHAGFENSEIFEIPRNDEKTTSGTLARQTLQRGNIEEFLEYIPEKLALHLKKQMVKNMTDRMKTKQPNGNHSRNRNILTSNN